MKTSLSIRALELSVKLGWPHNERKEPQTIHLDIDVIFATPPKACDSDHLDDTYCYATIAEKIRQHFALSTIHLIEHLSKEIYLLLKPIYPQDANVTVRIYKHPKVEGLTGGVCFSYGD